MDARRDKSPLEKHIGFFSGPDGNVSYDSLLNSLTSLGDPHAKIKANAVSFMGGIKVNGCPFSMFKPIQGVGALNHPRDTGIYQMDGTINEARWKKMCEWAENDKGIFIITEKNFYQFLDWARQNDDRYDFLGYGKTFSDGEWKDFFRFCTDYWKETDAGKEPAVSIDTLRTFFENTPEILNRVIDKELPVKSPSKSL